MESKKHFFIFVLFVVFGLLGTTSQALLKAGEESHNWQFTRAFCSNGKTVSIIPFVENLQILLQVKKGHGIEPNSTKKSASVMGCGPSLVETEFSYFTEQTRFSADGLQQVGQLRGEKILGHKEDYKAMEACGMGRVAKSVSWFLFEVIGYADIELHRKYTYQIAQDKMYLSFWDARCMGTMTMEFKTQQ